MKIRLTEEKDLSAVMGIIEEAKRSLGALGISQWQNGYPNAASILADIKAGISYVAEEEDGTVSATAAISFLGELTYDRIYEGGWLTSSKAADTPGMAAMDKPPEMPIAAVMANEEPEEGTGRKFRSEMPAAAAMANEEPEEGTGRKFRSEMPTAAMPKEHGRTDEADTPETAPVNVERYAGCKQALVEYAVVHRIAVAAVKRRQGYASALLRFAAELASERGAASVRIDTQEGNVPMRAFLAREGFAYCGIIYLQPEHNADTKRLAYERRL